MTLALFQLLNALIWSVVLALIALGLNLVYGVLGVINVAHGAFYMLGAVGAWALLAPLEGLGLPYALAFAGVLVIAPGLVGLGAWGLERVALRPLITRPILTIIATFAVMIALEQIAQELIPGVPTVRAPVAGSFPLLGLQYPLYRLVVAGLALAIMIGVGAGLARTRFGLWVRAVRQDPELAQTLGVPVPGVYGATFGVGAALAAVAGVLTAPIVAVEARMGLDVLIDAFMIVIVGGLGSLGGAVVAAFLYRMAEGLLSVGTDPVMARAVALGLMAALLVWRPQGLFGARDDA